MDLTQPEGSKPSPAAQCSAATYPEMDREIVKLLRMSGENYEQYAASRIEKLESACRIALWIRDRLQERGSFGAGFEEWLDIERVLPPNEQAETRRRTDDANH